MSTSPTKWLLAWIGAVVAAVGIGLYPGDITGESWCGVWGCFPPIQALISLHLLWFLVLAPPAMILAARRPGRTARRIGGIILVIGLLATACVISTGLTQWWYSTSDPDYPGMALRRAGFSLATRTEVPALELALTGSLVIVAGRRSGSKREDPSAL